MNFEDVRSWFSSTWQGCRQWVRDHARALRRGFATLLLFAIASGMLYLSYKLAGLLATVAYTLMFVLGATLLPMLILMFRDGLPGSALVGKLEFALGQLAFGRGWLVQREDGWAMHPGRQRNTTEEVWIDGEWLEVPDDANMTILGWQPFGILLDKTDDAVLLDHREDPQASALRERELGAAATDGGETALQRGGIEQATGPPVDAADDVWWLDLKRYWSRGLERMADITLIEKVEEVTMRKEALNQRGAKQTWLPVLVGLLLGAMTGYVAMAGF